MWFSLNNFVEQYDAFEIFVDVCPGGYIRYDGNGMCYKFEAMEKTWLAAMVGGKFLSHETKTLSRIRNNYYFDHNSLTENSWHTL